MFGKITSPSSLSLKQVGCLVVQLKSFSCEDFKLGFFLCNDVGFQSALDFSLSDWVEVKLKKQRAPMQTLSKVDVLPSQEQLQFVSVQIIR